MADAVNTSVLYYEPKLYVARFTNISDSSGESGVVKIDRSALVGPNGTEPANLIIKEMRWSIQGFKYVSILWDHNTDDQAAVLGTGTGWANYSGTNGLVDPGSAGGTGDILFTTNGAAAGNTYDITLVVALQGNP